MSVKLLVIVGLVVLVFIGLALNAYRMMRQTDRMLDQIDKNKLRDLRDDDWDD